MDEPYKPKVYGHRRWVHLRVDRLILKAQPLICCCNLHPPEKAFHSMLKPGCRDLLHLHRSIIEAGHRPEPGPYITHHIPAWITYIELGPCVD